MQMQRLSGIYRIDLFQNKFDCLSFFIQWYCFINVPQKVCVRVLDFLRVNPFFWSLFGLAALSLTTAWWRMRLESDLSQTHVSVTYSCVQSTSLNLRFILCKTEMVIHFICLLGGVNGIECVNCSAQDFTHSTRLINGNQLLLICYCGCFK